MMRYATALAITAVLFGCTQVERTELKVPAATPAGEPYLFRGDTSVFLSWIEVREETNYLKYSRLDGNNWSDPVTIASGKNWFVNWADYPIVATNGKHFAATFLEKSSEATFAYDVKLTTSADGVNWSTPVVLHDDGKKAEHGFVSIVPYGGNFFLSWLDGRNTVMEGMEDMEEHEGHHGQMSLRAAVIDVNGTKLKEWELDNRVCDCCQTTAAITSTGPVVVYRDRSRDEVRDMSIVRLVDDSWTDPVRVSDDGWRIEGCPVNGPRMVARGLEVVVAWFTGVGGNNAVKYAYSNDGGATFLPPVRIDRGNPVGRVDIVMSNENTAYITWVEDGYINWVEVNEKKIDGDVVKVAQTSGARAAGFPQMETVEITGSKRVFVYAWTDAESKEVKSLVWR